MLRLVYGCPGSDKSEYLTNQIKNALDRQKKVILIVSERFSVSAEQELAKVCTARRMMDLEVLSFKRLCDLAFRTHGGLCYNYAGKGGMMLMMWRALSEVKDRLTAYKQLQLRDSGTIETMLESIVSYQRAAIPPEKFKEAAASDACAPELRKKCGDLAEIYEAYVRLLRDRYDDPEDDMTRLYELLGVHPFFKGKEVFVDTLTAFSGQEIRVVERAMAQADNVTVGLEYLPDDDRTVFGKLRWCRDMLLKSARRVGCRVDREVICSRIAAKEKDLIHLEKWLFDPLAAPYTGEERNISLYTAEDIYEECKTAAARILRDVQENGGRYRDHAVAVRDLDAYTGIIDRVFESNGVPYTLKSSRTLSSRAAFRAVMSALRLVCFSFRKEDLFSYLRSGYSGIDDDDCFALEDYVNMWRIEGARRWDPDREFLMNPEGRTGKTGEKGAEALKRIGEVKRALMKPLWKLYEDLGGRKTVKEKAAALYAYAVDMRLSERLEEEEKKYAEARENDEALLCARTWGAFCDLLDDLVYSVGDVTVDNDEFRMMVGLLSDRAMLATIPPGSDRVLITDAHALKPGELKYMHALGQNEGVFPAQIRSGGMFSRAETKALRALDLDLPGDEERAVFDEEYLLYTVLTQPAKKLFMTAYLKDLRGAAAKPSEVFADLCSFYPKADNEVSPPEDLLYGAQNCLEKALSGDGSPEAAALLASMGTVERDAAEKTARAPLSAGAEAFTPACAATLYGGKAPVTTQSRLERFAECPFGYTCEYLLSLEEKCSPDTGSNEIGTIIHSVFEQVVRESIQTGKALGTYTDAELHARADAVMDAIERAMLGGSDDYRVQGLLRRMKQSVYILLENLRDEFAQSDFRPVYCELSFRANAGGGAVNEETGDPLFPGIVVPGGVTVVGTVDRVDVYKKDHTVYLRVVDYKTGKKKITSKLLAEGKGLQMPLYMRALLETADPRFKERIGAGEGDAVRPAAVVYHILSMPKVRADGESRELLVKKLREGIARSGLCVMDRDLLYAMDKKIDGTFGPYVDGKRYTSDTLPALGEKEFCEKLSSIDETVRALGERMRKGEAAATPGRNDGNCKYCPMLPVCRAQNAAEDAKDGDGGDGGSGDDGE